VWRLSSEENILQKFANKLLDTDKERYSSKFIRIYNELKKHFKISEALKAGSIGKQTKIELYGDLDLVFTISNPEKNNDTDMRNLLEKRMKISFPNDDVKLKMRSILITFEKDFSVDVVYLSKQEFEKEKKQIKHIKSISNDIRDIIVLAKYAKYEKKLTNLKSYRIEWNAIYSSAKTFQGKLRDTIHKSGGGGHVKELYTFILENAR